MTQENSTYKHVCCWQLLSPHLRHHISHPFSPGRSGGDHRLGGDPAAGLGRPGQPDVPQHRRRPSAAAQRHRSGAGAGGAQRRQLLPFPQRPGALRAHSGAAHGKGMEGRDDGKWKGWDGMGWDGMGWDGMVRYETVRDGTEQHPGPSRYMVTLNSTQPGAAAGRGKGGGREGGADHAGGSQSYPADFHYLYRVFSRVSRPSRKQHGRFTRGSHTCMIKLNPALTWCGNSGKWQLVEIIRPSFASSAARESGTRNLAMTSLRACDVNSLRQRWQVALCERRYNSISPA